MPTPIHLRFETSEGELLAERTITADDLDEFYTSDPCDCDAPYFLVELDARAVGLDPPDMSEPGP